MMKFNKKLILLLCVNLAVLLVSAVWYVRSTRNLTPVAYDLDDWLSREAEYRDHGLFVSKNIRDKGKEVDFLWGPYGTLKKGSYTAIIEYEAENDQHCLATASGGKGNAQLYESSEGILSRHTHTLTYRFEVLDDVNDFQIVFTYSGTGDFGVHSISISPSNLQAKRTVAEVIMLLLLADGLFFLSGRSSEVKRTAFALAAITALISVPLAYRGIDSGHDLMTHFLRIEAIVQALRSGQFPARISSVVYFGFGYPFSIYYNDMLLYFPAVLRLLGFSVTTAYKFYVTAVNLLTVVISYYAFSRIFGDKKKGMLLTLLYVTASYRLVNVYIRAAVGEYSAQAFLPLLGLAFYRIFADGKGSGNSWFRNSVLLAVSVSGLIGTHVLTCIMACFIMLLVCVVLFRRLFRGKTLLTLICAVLLTLLLNLYFIVPFVDYYFSVPTVISEIVGKSTQMIQQYGAFPAQFMAFFQNNAGKAEKPINERLQLTPGLVLMAVLFLAIYLFFFRKKDRKLLFLMGFSLLTLWMASDLFPWNTLTRHVPGWNFLAQIQFPWRWLIFSVLFLTLLAGEVVDALDSRSFRIGLALAAALMSLWFMGNFFSQVDVIRVYDTSGVKLEWTGPEYMLLGASADELDVNVQSRNMKSAEILSRDSRRMLLFCDAGDGEGSHLVSAPVFNYKGYQVRDDAGNLYAIDPDVVGRINFELPDGFAGNVAVEFKDPVLWTVGLWISAGTALLLAVWCGLKKRHA